MVRVSRSLDDFWDKQAEVPPDLKMAADVFPIAQLGTTRPACREANARPEHDAA